MSANPHIVFYDDACPLCDAEIGHYKKIKTLHDIDWLGINSSWDDIQHYRFSKETLLKRIHAVHSDGTIVTGAAAFALIWNSLKYCRVLGFIVTKFKLITLLEFFYKRFADWRYKKNQVCKINK